MTNKRHITKILEIYQTNKKTFLTFLVTGIGTTLLYICFFSLLWYILHTSHVMAVNIAFAIAASYQFFANRKITFKVKDKRYIPQMLRYFMLIIINYLISVYTVDLSVWWLDSPLLGLILTTMITPLTGYLLFKFWVFKDPLPNSSGVQH